MLVKISKTDRIHFEKRRTTRRQTKMLARRFRSLKYNGLFSESELNYAC